MPGRCSASRCGAAPRRRTRRTSCPTSFLTAWRRIADVPAGEEARLWLYGVARHALANQRRGARRRTRLGEALREHVRTLPVPPPEPADPELHAALAGLPELDRSLLALDRLGGPDADPGRDRRSASGPRPRACACTARAPACARRSPPAPPPHAPKERSDDPRRRPPPRRRQPGAGDPGAARRRRRRRGRRAARRPARGACGGAGDRARRTALLGALAAARARPRRAPAGMEAAGIHTGFFPGPGDTESTPGEEYLDSSAARHRRRRARPDDGVHAPGRRGLGAAARPLAVRPSPCYVQRSGIGMRGRVVRALPLGGGVAARPRRRGRGRARPPPPRVLGRIPRRRATPPPTTAAA